MVRSPAAGPAPVAAPPDYFDSLSELASYAAAPRPPRSRFAAPQVPLAHLAAQADDSKGRGKLLVCHDYKGGYSERDDERGYTFGWWHLVNTFIYFSHHRVSCPPAGWIRAAHQGGTKILGTLIFEHGAGRFDIVELVAPSSSGSSTAAPAFERLSTRYADSLVDLALERGFDGWLVNVEVELGGEGATGEQKRAHARALIAWLRYFSGEMRRRVPGGEVMWYDAVTTDGQLAWQNALTERNLPFFTACDSIFLNYWWRGDQLASTAALLDRLGSGRRQDVYFGIDVFGRGTLAGGGFEAWRAVHKIEQRLGTGAEGSSFSTALFAPGWTVEAESLSHSLSSPEAFARWQTDDDFLFSRTTPTPSVAPEAARHDRERREQRGVLRARHLAAQTAPSALPVPLVYRVPSPPTFDYNAPLEPPPGAELGVPHKPLAAFLPAPRPSPAPEARFYTNFSGGSGFGMFVAGEKVFERGWTDPAFASPAAALALHPPGLEGISAMVVEYDAWEGPRALEVRVEREGDAIGGDATATRAVPLCVVALPPLASGDELVVDCVWKRRSTSGDTNSREDLVPRLASAAGEPVPAAVPPAVEELSRGWRRSRGRLTVSESSPAGTWHLSVDVPHAQTFLLGSLSLAPAPSPATPVFVLSRPGYHVTSSSLRWELDVRPAPLEAHAPLSATKYPSLARPQHFHLFHRTPADKTYLGTTVAQEFPLDLARLGGRGEVLVVADFADGTTQEAATAVETLSG